MLVVTLMLLSWWLSYVVSREQWYANRQAKVPILRFIIVRLR